MGMLADRFGGRIVFTLLMFFVIAPVAMVPSVSGYGNLLLVAFLLGMAGSSFSVGVGYVSPWFSIESQGSAPRWATSSFSPMRVAGPAAANAGDRGRRLRTRNSREEISAFHTEGRARSLRGGHSRSLDGSCSQLLVQTSAWSFRPDPKDRDVDSRPVHS